MTAFTPLWQQGFSWWETLCMRILLSLTVLRAYSSMIDQLAGLEDQPAAVGIARFADLTSLADYQQLLHLRWLLAASLLLYCGGRLLPMLVGLMASATVFIAPATLLHSQGAIGHSLQIVGLVLLAQLTVALILAAHELLGSHSDPANAASCTAWACIQTVVAVYTVAGLTKLHNSGLAWISEARFFPVQMVKAHSAAYYNTLVENEFAGVAADLARLLIESPTLCSALIGLGLALELLSILALLGRGWAAVVGLVLLGFHLANSVTLVHGFRYNTFLVAIFLVNVPYWLARALDRIGTTPPPTVSSANVTAR